MAWLPGVPAPCGLWAIGEEVAVTVLDTTKPPEQRAVLTGRVERYFSPYSVGVSINNDKTRLTLASCGQIRGAAERHANYVADVAMGLRASLPEWIEQTPD